MGVIRFIFIFIVAYLIISLITRYVIPFILRLFFRYISNKSRNRYYRDKNRESRKEGEIKVDYTPRPDKKIDKDSGEYVDYEEVDE